MALVARQIHTNAVAPERRAQQTPQAIIPDRANKRRRATQSSERSRRIGRRPTGTKRNRRGHVRAALDPCRLAHDDVEREIANGHQARSVRHAGHDMKP